MRKGARPNSTLALIAFGGIAAMVGVGWAASTYWGSQATNESQVARKASDFQLIDSRGQRHSLSEMRGKTTLIHFWASWCPPCIGELPEILQLARDFDARGLKVILVSLDQGWNEALKALGSNALPSNVLSLLDPQQEVSEIYGSRKLPETFLLNPQLEIIAKLVGSQKWNTPTFRRGIERILPSTR